MVFGTFGHVNCLASLLDLDCLIWLDPARINWLDPVFSIRLRNIRGHLECQKLDAWRMNDTLPIENEMGAVQFTQGLFKS